ncbi:MAG TPA: hypothetical protein VFR86_08040 [Burkholderiaceae bacterium]|nr:hypothetical protein [Burkholderiaceae bacterium]
MSRVLPQPHEAQQLCRLRALRVQRARARVDAAQVEVENATQAVQRRRRQIESWRRAIDDLSHAVVHTLAPTLPRWSTVAKAQREHLHSRLEREAFALSAEEEQLDAAHERLRQARAEFSQALAREDVVRDLAHETRNVRTRERERRAERELEDRRPAAPAPRGAT